MNVDCDDNTLVDYIINENFYKELEIKEFPDFTEPQNNDHKKIKIPRKSHQYKPRNYNKKFKELNFSIVGGFKILTITVDSLRISQSEVAEILDVNVSVLSRAFRDAISNIDQLSHLAYSRNKNLWPYRQGSGEIMNYVKSNALPILTMFLKLELVPTKSLGDFVLGMSISEALNIVKNNNVQINTVQIIFNDNDPLSLDIVIKLIDDGVLLRFEPKLQRLKVIEIFDVKKLSLSYRGSVFNQEDHTATFVDIYSKFGPSYPGDFNLEKSIYHLHYPGLSFSFRIPPEFKSLYEGTELPVELPDGSTPLVEKIFIYNSLQMKTPLIVVPHFNEEIIVCPNEGIYFTKRNCMLTFKSTTQDVLSELGPPSKIYHKEEDNMKIHTSVEGSIAQDYFYNYFYLGIDILFDIKKNVIKKFILHTNFPTHYEFNFNNQTPNCSSIIFNSIKNHLSGKTLNQSVSSNSTPSSTSTTSSSQHQQHENNSNNNSQQSPLSSSPSNLSILPAQPTTDPNNNEYHLDPTINFVHPDLKWDDVQKIFGKGGKPVVNNRGSVSNPFGSTYFYGYSGIIYEIMKNNYIASVCLFNDKNNSVDDNNLNISQQQQQQPQQPQQQKQIKGNQK
ncbi:hypothetical protein DICPUDRAFT_159906 [Dictyostelium purpureum]|uniref:Uncharacterized protein n=1 Tax=Dictyostelium purpureum TaxID=5786 RepID=F1A591_DICPU|nr:uncharacterized protein DICPUDRAFT_159906 [Dictyostelium purpureum]EGC28642.1 hypothetical protein DICPUDRAFT_159906 [Dictyostelium purpureum]|eukprot:XP_003294835.1 hypothetical protein DICPUDRAFT_159906 [Dictyostelium purpureum]